MGTTDYPNPSNSSDWLDTIESSTLVTAQETRRLFTNAQPVVTPSELQLQTDHTPHDPAQREDGKTKSAPMNELGALFALLNDDRKKVPRNGETPRKVALYGRIGIREIDHLEKKAEGDVWFQKSVMGRFGMGKKVVQ